MEQKNEQTDRQQTSDEKDPQHQPRKEQQQRRQDFDPKDQAKEVKGGAWRGG